MSVNKQKQKMSQKYISNKRENRTVAGCRLGRRITQRDDTAPIPPQLDNSIQSSIVLHNNKK